MVENIILSQIMKLDLNREILRQRKLSKLSKELVVVETNLKFLLSE